MATVTITVTPKGVIVNPLRVHINRVDQLITWNLTGGAWQNPGIVMDMNPPAPFLPWPGTPAHASPTGNNWEANGNDPLTGDQPQQYRYTINIIDDQGNKHTSPFPDENSDLSIDPDVENDPRP